MKTSEAQKRAVSKYQKKLASITFRVKEEEAEKYKTAAVKAGMSFREFIIRSMEEKIEKDNL